MKAEEKETKLLELKAAFYDCLAAKQRAEMEMARLNEEIGKVLLLKTEE